MPTVDTEHASSPTTPFQAVVRLPAATRSSHVTYAIQAIAVSGSDTQDTTKAIDRISAAPGGSVDTPSHRRPKPIAPPTPGSVRSMVSSQ